LEIYKDNYEISRSITIELDSDLFYFCSYDSGNGFEEEKIITVEDIASLKKAMNAKSDDELLSKIKAKFSKVNGVEQFFNYLEKRGVDVIYHCFTK
jgi:hypothetical protein